MSAKTFAITFSQQKINHFFSVIYIFALYLMIAILIYCNDVVYM